MVLGKNMAGLSCLYPLTAAHHPRRKARNPAPADLPGHSDHLNIPPGPPSPIIHTPAALTHLVAGPCLTALPPQLSGYLPRLLDLSWLKQTPACPSLHPSWDPLLHSLVHPKCSVCIFVVSVSTKGQGSLVTGTAPTPVVPKVWSLEPGGVPWGTSGPS